MKPKKDDGRRRRTFPPAEIAVALSEVRHVETVAARDSAAECLAALGWREAPLSGMLDGRALSRIHFGNEFCERLIPAPRDLERALERAAAAGLVLTLATPGVAESGLGQLRRLFEMLADGAEVVANDLGVLRLVGREFPSLVPVVGRQLCKMIKDPRLPSSQWTRLSPPGLDAPQFADLVGRLGARRVEIDVPPFAEAGDLRAESFGLSAHAPYGYALKGRVCRVGSMGLEPGDKFTVAHQCRKECLTYIGEMTRSGGLRDLHTFQRGNAVFYRHSPGMAAALAEAVERGWVERIVLSGDWNENRRAAEQG